MSTFIALRQCKAVEDSMEKAIESVLTMMEENKLAVDEIEAPLLAASQKAFKEMKKQEIQEQLNDSTTGFIDSAEVKSFNKELEALKKELLNDEWAFTAEKPDWGVTVDEMMQKELKVLLDEDDSDDDSWVKEENDKDELNESTATAIEPEEEETKADEVNQLNESTATAILPEEEEKVNESTATAILPEEEEKMNESTATAIEPEEPVNESQKEQSLHQLAAAAIDIQQEEEVVSSDSYETESSSEEESDEDEEESSDDDSSADEMAKLIQNSHLLRPVRDLPLPTTSVEKPASDNDRWIDQLENLDKMDSADQTKMLENMINEMKKAWF